jgi:hypothetical protein
MTTHNIQTLVERLGELLDQGFQPSAAIASEALAELTHQSAEIRALKERVAQFEAAANGAVPEGWKLAPIDPTEEMIQAACLKQSNVEFASYAEWLDSHSSGVSARIRDLVAGDYRAMLAAAIAASAEKGEAT